MKMGYLAVGAVLVLLAPLPASAASLTTNVGAAANSTTKAVGTTLNAGASASTSSSAGVGAMSGSAAASASLSSHSSFKQLTASISSGGGTSIDIAALPAKTKVRIVEISHLKGYRAAAASSLSTNANVGALDASIAANASLTGILKAHGFTPNQVVAASKIGSTLDLFVNSKAKG
jgi:hypothetical protein